MGYQCNEGHYNLGLDFFMEVVDLYLSFQMRTRSPYLDECWSRYGLQMHTRSVRALKLKINLFLHQFPIKPNIKNPIQSNTIRHDIYLIKQILAHKRCLNIWVINDEGRDTLKYMSIKSTLHYVIPACRPRSPQHFPEKSQQRDCYVRRE